MRKMKVLFLIQDLKHGGAEKVLVNLANNMDKGKFDVTIKTLFDTGIHKGSINNDVRYVPGLKNEFRGNSYIFRLLPAKWLFHFFVKEDYDVVVSFLEGNATKVLAGASAPSIKKVAWVHIEMQSIRTSFITKQNALDAYLKFDRIVCVSETVMSQFEIAAGKTFNNICVLYNVNETEQIIRKSKEKISDVEFSNNTINLISVAKIVPSKGYDRLIPVIAKLNSEIDGRKIHLYLLGAGEQRKELEELTKKLGIQEYVTFLGFRDNPYKYVKAADLYVCSSRKEGFSTAVTEALVLGTPVVSTDCSGARELLGMNNEYGIVVSNSTDGIYEGIWDMLCNQKLEYYALKSRERGKQFSARITTKSVEDMLENL